MTFSRVRLDHKGLEQTLKTDPGITSKINDLVEKIGQSCRDAAEDPDEVFVDHYTTDRTAGAVTVLTEEQVKNGILTRAAAKAGLEVKTK